MINGTYRLLYIKWDSVFLPVGCLTSDGFSESVDILETTTRDNNGWKTQTPTNQSYNISFDGIILNTNFNGGDFSKVSLDRLRFLKRNRQLIEWELRTDDLTFVDSGKGYITELSDSANVDEFVTFNATILGYGQPISTTRKFFDIQDGNNNNIQDGNNNNIQTI